MNRLRRALVAALALTLVRPLAALAAWNKEAFGANTPGDALKGLGIANAMPSNEVTIDAPQIAENGAVVPVEISSAIAGTTALMVVIEKNPFPLVARFDFKDGALPFVKVNVKMGETSDIRVLAEAGGKYYSATKEVKVTIGGCGG
jgi:sulfur-oxidizing protein SoxY